MVFDQIPKTVIIFPANVPHALSAIKKFRMTLTMIRE